MKTSIRKYKTLILVLFGFLTAYQLPAHVQKVTNSYNPFEEIKFNCDCENSEAFVSPVYDNITLPVHNLNKKNDAALCFIIYDLSNYTDSNPGFAKINFHKTDFSSYENEFYFNSENISQKLPSERALRTDILLI